MHSYISLDLLTSYMLTVIICTRYLLPEALQTPTACLKSENINTIITITFFIRHLNYTIYIYGKKKCVYIFKSCNGSIQQWLSLPTFVAYKHLPWGFWSGENYLIKGKWFFSHFDFQNVLKCNIVWLTIHFIKKFSNLQTFFVLQNKADYYDILYI